MTYRLKLIRIARFQEKTDLKLNFSMLEEPVSLSNQLLTHASLVMAVLSTTHQSRLRT